jgi:hypothetical protein
MPRTWTGGSTPSGLLKLRVGKSTFLLVCLISSLLWSNIFVKQNKNQSGGNNFRNPNVHNVWTQIFFISKFSRHKITLSNYCNFSGCFYLLYLNSSSESRSTPWSTLLISTGSYFSSTRKHSQVLYHLYEDLCIPGTGSDT